MGVSPQARANSPMLRRADLVLLDPASGGRSTNDDPLMQAVVVDLRSGEELVRTSGSMGDPATDDLRDLYEDATPGVLGTTDETAYVHAPSDVLAIDLSTGDVTVDDAAVVRPALRGRASSPRTARRSPRPRRHARGCSHDGSTTPPRSASRSTLRPMRGSSTSRRRRR